MIEEQDLGPVLDACPDAFVAVDADQRIVHWSSGAQRLLGWTADEVLGRPDPSVPPDAVAAGAAAVRMLATGTDPGTSWQAPRLTRDGRRVMVQLTGLAPLSSPRAFGVFFRRPDREQQEAHVRNRLAGVLSAAVTRGDVIAAVDDALVELMDATGTAVLIECTCGAHLVADPQGRCDDPVRRTAWVDLTDGFDEARVRGLAHAQMHTDTGQTHVCLVRLGPRTSGMRLAVGGVHDRVGDRRALVSLRAVADQAWVALQRAELVVRLQGRVDVLEALDASRTEAIAGVTHDLKAPVHVLSGFVETLRRRPAGSIDHDQALYAMDRQIERIARLVDDLLLAARAVDGPVRPATVTRVDVADLLLDGREALGPGTREEVAVEHEPDLEVLGDPDQLARVLTNLVDNALKYGGRERPVEVRAVRAGPEIVVTVRDHGPGLGDDERDRVFGRFVVGRSGRETGSTGLGLHVARAIARGHGGELVALPAPAQAPGALFELRLPAADAHGRPD